MVEAGPNGRSCPKAAAQPLAELAPSLIDRILLAGWRLRGPCAKVPAPCTASKLGATDD